MPTVSILPNSDISVAEYNKHPGGEVGKWSCIDESITAGAVDDTNNIYTDYAVGNFFGLADPPEDMDSAASAIIKFRIEDGGYGDWATTTIQVYESDGTTALTGEFSYTSVSGTRVTVTQAVSATGDRADWLSSRLKMSTTSDGEGQSYIYAVEVYLTYNTAGGWPPVFSGIAARTVGTTSVIQPPFGIHAG